mgnify:FL=1
MGYSVARGFWGVTLCVVSIAAGTGGITPAFVREMTKHFPSQKRGVALGIFQMRFYLGSGLASFSLIISDCLGWRLTFVVIGVAGLFVCLVSSFLLRSETTGELQTSLLEYEAKTNLLENLSFTLNNKVVLFVMIAAMCRYAATYARGFFAGIYFAQVFPGHTHQFSVLNALFLFATPLSLYLGGKLADYKENTCNFRWTPMICSLTNLVSVPFAFFMSLTNSFTVASVCLSVISVVGETYNSLNISLILNSTPRNMQAFQTGLMLCVTVLAGSLSCLVVGSRDLEDLALMMLVVLTAGYFLSSVFYYLASPHYERTMQQKSLLYSVNSNFK